MAEGLKGSLFWSFMEQGGASLVGFVVQIVLARLLAPEVFGVMAILLVFTSLMDSVAQSGLGSSLIQQKGADDDSFSTAFWLSFFIAVILYVVLFFSAPFISDFYQMGEMALYLRVLGLAVLFNSFNSIQRSYLQRSMDFKRLFKANFLGLLLSGTIGICCAFLGFGVWALVAQTLAQGACACLTLMIFVPWKPRFVFKRQEAGELFRFGWKICATGMINVLHDGISELVIGKSCDAASLGYYSQGRKYPNMVIGVITNALSNVIYPAFAQIKEDANALRGSLKAVLDAGTFIIAPMSILLCVIAEPVVLLLLGEKWLPSVFIFQLTFGVNAFLMFQLVNLRAYMALGESSLYLKINLIKSGMSIVAICAVAILTRDIYLTAIATSLCNVLGIFFVDMPWAKRVHGYGALRQMRDQLPTYGICMLAALCAAACGFIPLNPVMVMVVQIIIFGIVYLSLSRVANRGVWSLCLSSLGIRLPKREQGT